MDPTLRTRIAKHEYKALLDAQLAEKKAREAEAKRREREEDNRRLKAATGKLGMLSSSPASTSPKQLGAGVPGWQQPDARSAQFAESGIA